MSCNGYADFFFLKLQTITIFKLLLADCCGEKPKKAVIKEKIKYCHPVRKLICYKYSLEIFFFLKNINDFFPIDFIIKV